MRFRFTMNMPSYKGNPVHQIIAEHPSKSLSELLEVLEDTGFILVEEFYIKRDMQTGESYFDSNGRVILNTWSIGKVTEFMESEGRHQRQDY